MRTLFRHHFDRIRQPVCNPLTVNMFAKGGLLASKRRPFAT